MIPKTRAAIIGLAGEALQADEVEMLRRMRPFGVILFARNVRDAEQLKNLTASIREELGGSTPILIDQEGGRVARLRPPHWPEFPPAARFENLPAEAAEANATLLGLECGRLGLDVVCAPVLDLRLPGAHGIIGDRSFGSSPAEVARLGSAWISGLQAAGTVPVMKHIPGHGRAMADSHHELPRVAASVAELDDDVAPFAALAGSGAWAMTAHILYQAWDERLPATLSPTVISHVIRGRIGFDGVLVSDDLAMQALQGPVDGLAAGAVAAGCDLVLHCTGRIDESRAALDGAPPISDRSWDRIHRAKAASARLSGQRPPDVSALAARLDAMLQNAA